MIDSSVSSPGEGLAVTPSWKEVKEVMAKYRQPSAWRSVFQIVNSVVPYGVLWYLMFRTLAVSYCLTLALAVLASGFLARVFIIHHDCGHGSFFKSRRANDVIGFITGVLTFTSYRFWRWEHAVHHASTGDLDRRNLGDVWTMTVQEYLDASRSMRFAYRVMRNPFVLFVLAPPFLFLILHRFSSKKASKRDRRSVCWTNLTILALGVSLSLLMGVKAYLMIQLPVMVATATAGVWLFYVQHQFEGVYWERHDEWDFMAAALCGSSYYKLPRILQWFSGNIGFHHIHHLCPGIPNYNLEKCHNEHPLFQGVTTVTLLSGLRALTFRLWDESQRRLVGWGHLHTLKRAKEPEAGAPVVKSVSIPDGVVARQFEITADQFGT